ncbi:MAG TPA: glycine cleavage T C-terminal barrel domain-containing protein [Chthoniobacterales bacterium]|nr:glycine cleavage T C-terminal barrel domain-containing protein [Chthoniobacterales bacterium]
MKAPETGRSAAEFRPEEGAVFDLSSRAKLRLSGADRLRYFNGQISNDLRKATEAHVLHACVLSAKGKINADVFVAVEGETFVIDSDPGTAEALTARLERYIIADDVQLEEITEEFALFHVIAVEAARLLGIGTCRRAERFGLLGIDVWMSRAEHESGRQALSQIAPDCDEDCAETFRIERGLPRWGHELTDAIIPNEANLEARAIDYAKGCYIGQEVISRIKMSGQTNKRLCGLIASDGSTLSPGMRLIAPGEAGKEVGWLTSVARSARLGRQIALGFVKRGFQDPGSRLEAQAATVTANSKPSAVEIVALPFA